MWCEMVGCPNPRPAVKSQMQIGASAFHKEATMVRRVGSDNAFINVDVLAAQSDLTLGSSQHSPRSRMTGSGFSATRQIIRQPIDIGRWDVLGSTHRSSSIKGALSHG